MADNPFAQFAPEASPPPVASGENPFAQFDTSQKKKKDDARDSVMGRVDAAVRGLADVLTFGTADEIAAGLGTGFGYLGDYQKELDRQRGIDKADTEDRFGYRLGGQLAGGVAGGAGLARSGLSMAANAAKAGQGLGRVAAASAAEGAALGGLHGAGSGEDLEGRLKGAVGGAAAGLALGGITPFAVAGAQAAARPVLAPVLARLRPETYANQALGEGVRRSGMTADEIADALAAARADSQGMFTVADALGNSGQRMLSTVARTPNNMRQTVVDTLTGRQMDQGRRVAAALEDASGTPLTAAKYQEMLRTRRAEQAAKNYEPVKTDRTAIDVSDPVAAANRAISPAADRLAAAQGTVPTDLAARAGIEGGEAAIRDPIRQALKEARSYLASDGLTVTNVEKAFRAKTNIDQMIAAATKNEQGGLVAELMPVQKSLDEALARTSPQYAAARDAYRVASQSVDAVDTGRAMAAPRTRPSDNLSTWGALPSDDARDAARVGYFDPLISRAENRAGTMSNSVRPLISESYRQELPVFASPGSADKLGRRLAREQRMFETASTALGGSKTADNLADAAEMSKFDPGVMMNLLRGHPVAAAVEAVTRLANEARGMPPAVIDRIASALLESNPNAARNLLRAGASRVGHNDAQKALAIAIFNNLAGSGTGRLAAP